MRFLKCPKRQAHSRSEVSVNLAIARSSNLEMMAGTKPGIIYFESFIKKSLTRALTHRIQSVSVTANEPSALRLCQSDGTVSQASWLFGEWGLCRSTLPSSPTLPVAMSVGQVDRPTAAAKLSARIH